jgi:outer membrane usher protein
MLAAQAASAEPLQDPFGSLPPPADATASSAQPLQLELVVNGVPSGLIVPVDMAAGGCEVALSDLEAAGLAVPAQLGERIDLKAQRRVEVEYDAPNQRLRIIAPTDWLPSQTIGADGKARRQAAQSSFGVLLNYDLNFSDSDGRSPQLAAWTEARMFGSFGQVSLTAAVRKGGGGGSRVIRYDLSWIRSDEDRMVTYEAGDFVTRGLFANRPVRMAGIQISRDFTVRPDVITYPLPQFEGAASLPSAVDLFIDGYRSARAEVAPGAFTVDAMPGLNGAGEAMLTVTDMLGRRVSTSMPFYVSNDLLRPGLLDFSVAAGLLRRNYGRRNFDYGDPAGTGSIRYGVHRLLTMEASLEATGDLMSGSVGGLVQLGNAGVVNAAYAYSSNDGVQGGRLTIGYQYRARRFGIAATHVRESADFADLGNVDERHRGRTTTTVTGSLSSNGLGSFAASYIAASDHEGQSLDLVNGSWSMPLARGVTLHSAATYELHQRAWSGSVNLIVPLGGRGGMLAAGAGRDPRGGTTLRADYGRAIPSDGGLGISATLARSSAIGMNGAAELLWRNTDIELRGGAQVYDGRMTRWAGAAGSIVAMDGGVFTANRIADAFVLVSTDGEPGIPVRYENQLVGVSDARGHVLVPWVSGYYPARYEIDPLNLPADTNVPMVERRVAVARGSGYLVEFPVRHIRTARITLVDASGLPLPVGAIATVNGKPPVPIGWDGLLFAEEVADDNRIAVLLPDGGGCAAQVSMPPQADIAGTIGPVTCQ